MSSIERAKQENSTLGEVLRSFPSVYPSQEMLAQIKAHYGPDRVVVCPEAQNFLERVKQGEELSPREKGQLYQFLTSGLGLPSTHGGAIYGRLSPEKAAKRTKKRPRSS